MSDEHDVDHLLRTARADVARLALQMRAARQAVEPEPEVEVPEEPALTASDLGVRPDAEPPGLAEDLARVRADALRLLSSARAEVAQRVATSNDDALQLLQGPAAGPGGPSLRVVVPPAAPAEVPLPVAVVAPAAPIVPADEPAEAVTEAIPVVAPEAVVPMVPAAIAAARAAVAAVPEAVPAVADPLGGVVVVVTVPQAGVPAYPMPAYPAPGYVAPPVEPKRPASKVLYADVVLPILAVVVLLIILLAWVG